MKINKNEHPIKLLEDLEKITNGMRNVARNSGVVEETESRVITSAEDEEEVDLGKRRYELVRFVFKNNGYNFIFTIDDLKLEWIQGKGKYISKYLCVKNPASENSTDYTEVWGDSEFIVNSFDSWVDLLKRYNDLKFIDPITKKYEDEIYENFKIIGNDADTIPFDTEQQIFLIRYLENSRKYLESKKEEYEVMEIIEEIDDLKRTVTRLPKNASMKKVSVILAKSKKKSMELFKELMTMFKKDLMKKILTNGYEYFDSIVKLLQG